MPRVRLEPATQAFERVKTVHASDGTVTEIGIIIFSATLIM
jgi:hypothetical protein